MPRGVYSVVPPLIDIRNATFFRNQPSQSVRDALSSVVTSTSKLDPRADKKFYKIGNPLVPEQLIDPSNPPLFSGLSFFFHAWNKGKRAHWAVVSPASGSRTALLEVLRGQHISFPPTARSYPYLTSNDAERRGKQRTPAQAFRYVGFDAERGGANSTIKGAYMSARYESRKEVGDFSVQDYLTGNTELNADNADKIKHNMDSELLSRVTRDLKLTGLLDMSVTQLSNGQTRRARIAKALLDEPEILLLDGPFMGLDPSTVHHLSDLLHDMASRSEPRVILSLSPGEFLPDWVTSLILTDEHYRIFVTGWRKQVVAHTKEMLRLTEPDRGAESTEEHLFVAALEPFISQGAKVRSSVFRAGLMEAMSAREKGTTLGDMMYHRKTRRYISRDGFLQVDPISTEPGEALVEMDGVHVKYGDKVVLGHDTEETRGLSWTVRRGERWGVFGANGSGKTTLLSLISSDHPQTYSQPVRLFGRSRLPEAGRPGISIFDIQARIGHSSPEVHTFFPRHISVRRALESAWADTPISKPRLDQKADTRINRALMWFQGELNPALGPTVLIHEEHNRSLFLQKAHLKIHDDYSTYFPYTLQRMLKEAQEQRSSGGAYDLNDKLPENFKEAWTNEDLFFDESWADKMKFGELSFSAQRVVLFLRAILKQPDLVILDEAFSGMDSFAKAKCLLYLSHGETMMLRIYNGDAKRTLNKGGPAPAPSMLLHTGRVQFSGLTKDQALVAVSHRPDEVPGCIRRWLTLPQPDEGTTRTGTLLGPLALSDYGWSAIWSPNNKSPSTVEEWLARYPEHIRKPVGRPRFLPKTPEEIAEDIVLCRELRDRIEVLRESYTDIVAPMEEDDSVYIMPQSRRKHRLSVRDLAALFGTADHAAIHQFIVGNTGSREVGYRWAKAYFDRLDGIITSPTSSDDDDEEIPINEYKSQAEKLVARHRSNAPKAIVGRPIRDMFAPENRAELRRRFLRDGQGHLPAQTVPRLRDLMRMVKLKEGEERRAKMEGASGPKI